jgi:hypothetical protein
MIMLLRRFIRWLYWWSSSYKDDPAFDDALVRAWDNGRTSVAWSVPKVVPSGTEERLPS